MKIATSELTGLALDWAVGDCQSMNSNPAWPYGKISWSPLWKCWTVPDANNAALRREWHPSTDWSQGGQIIEREFIATAPRSGYRPIGSKGWDAYRACRPISEQFRMTGPTPLIAAMRCFVASRLGDEVDVPKELA